MATKFKTVDDYIASQPKSVQGLLERVRGTIRRAVPGAEEVISYGIPAFKLNGRPVLYFAGWKQHYSLYPSTAPLVSAFRKELAPYEVNNKGTIRFPLSQPVPAKLIASLARFRAKEVTGNPQAKRAGRQNVVGQNKAYTRTTGLRGARGAT
jgi:uncharacterized protein YdhG (YjbR/CyaY superfamily)